MIWATSLTVARVADELAVDPTEEAHLAGVVAGQPAGRLALLLPAPGDERGRGRRRRPTCPWTRRCTRGGARRTRRPPTWPACRRRRTRRRRGGRRRPAPRPARRSCVGRPRVVRDGCPGSFATTSAGAVGGRGGRGRRACRCRGTGGGRAHLDAVPAWRHRRGEVAARTSRRRTPRRSRHRPGSAITLVPSRRRSGTSVTVPSSGERAEVLRRGAGRCGRRSRGRSPCRRSSPVRRRRRR